MAITFELNGETLVVPPSMERASLLEVLRGVGGIISAKDGCAPQGQCGCCTVLVDHKARVSCVTPVRRVGGRAVTTFEGLDEALIRGWSHEFVAHGATQCGFCTPGIIMRLEERRSAAPGGVEVQPAAVERALAAHLCRCTGWQGITEVAVEVLGRGTLADGRGHVGTVPSGPAAEPAARRASLEGGTPQRVEPAMVANGAGFAADTAPADALVAVPGPDGQWLVGETLHEARGAASKVQGRRTTVEPSAPLEVPPGDWDGKLATCWVEPAYLETDASWCSPGGEPADPLANGGAFGAKTASPLPAVARRLADEHGRSVVALWSREDTVRHGPKRPPVAIGVNSDGTGIARVAATEGILEAIGAVAPDLVVEEARIAGPPTTMTHRAAGWAEAFCALLAAGAPSPVGGVVGAGVRVEVPGGGWASVEVRPGAPQGDARASDGSILIEVGAGEPLDETVLRSYVIGAAHMAASMVCSEAMAVDDEGAPQDLTIRSFGVLSAAAMPHVEVRIDPAGGVPLRVSEAVFAATAAAVWRHHGFPPRWPLSEPVL